MESVQNLRKAIYESVLPLLRCNEDSQDSFKIKIEAAERGSSKYNALLHQGINYLYRCELLSIEGMTYR